jgi:hypothetical protein
MFNTFCPRLKIYLLFASINSLVVSRQLFLEPFSDPNFFFLVQISLKASERQELLKTHPEVCKNINFIYLAYLLGVVLQQGVTGHDASIVYQNADFTNLFFHFSSHCQNSISV